MKSHALTRKALTIGLMVLAATAEAQPPPTQCTEPRPQMCPQIYNPVCGVTADGTKKTYGNGCTACAEKSVTGHTPGACT